MLRQHLWDREDTAHQKTQPDLEQIAHFGNVWVRLGKADSQEGRQNEKISMDVRNKRYCGQGVSLFQGKAPVTGCTVSCQKVLKKLELRPEDNKNG